MEPVFNVSWVGMGRPRVLVLTGGLIHLVHQLAVLHTLLQEWDQEATPLIAIVVTGVLRKQPEALATMHREIDRWMSVLQKQNPQQFKHVRSIHRFEELEPGAWDIALLNNLWLDSQHQLARQLDIRQVVVCGDGFGVYYRCARELRAIIPSLLNLPISGLGLSVHYFLMSIHLNWHRPPTQSQRAAISSCRMIFSTLQVCQDTDSRTLVRDWIKALPPKRNLWLLSIPNLAHHWESCSMPKAVLHSWVSHLSHYHGFDVTHDKLILIEHPKSPPTGSFGKVSYPWIDGPYRPSAPIEILVAMAQDYQSERQVLVAGITSSLFGVRALTGAEVAWLPLLPLLINNPSFWRKPVDFLHRWIRKHRMVILTSKL